MKQENTYPAKNKICHRCGKECWGYFCTKCKSGRNNGHSKVTPEQIRRRLEFQIFFISERISKKKKLTGVIKMRKSISRRIKLMKIIKKGGWHKFVKENHVGSVI